MQGIGFAADPFQWGDAGIMKKSLFGKDFEGPRVAIVDGPLWSQETDGSDADGVGKASDTLVQDAPEGDGCRLQTNSWSQP
jgi:hypothetical protein